MERPRVERQRGREIEKWGGGYMESGKWEGGRRKGRGWGWLKKGLGWPKKRHKGEGGRGGPASVQVTGEQSPNNETSAISPTQITKDTKTQDQKKKIRYKTEKQYSTTKVTATLGYKMEEYQKSVSFHGNYTFNTGTIHLTVFIL